MGYKIEKNTVQETLIIPLYARWIMIFPPWSKSPAV